MIYGVPQPFLPAQGVDLEAEEKGEQTNGGLELIRIPPFVVPKPFEELVTASVEDVVGSHSRIGAH